MKMVMMGGRQTHGCVMQCATVVFVALVTKHLCIIPEPHCNNQFETMWNRTNLATSNCNSTALRTREHGSRACSEMAPSASMVYRVLRKDVIRGRYMSKSMRVYCTSYTLSRYAWVATQVSGLSWCHMRQLAVSIVDLQCLAASAATVSRS
jgi:hypothetical protein